MDHETHARMKYVTVRRRFVFIEESLATPRVWWSRSRTRTASETPERYKAGASLADAKSGGVMDDTQVHGQIEQLVAEEHELWDREAAGNGTDSDRQRLQELKVSLDQCWDLLRQRRALRDDGRDPDAADIRRPEVVEGYEQ